MRKVAVFLLLVVVCHQQILTPQATFCWRDSYGRGVGTPLHTCPSGREKIGLLCYSKCPAGYSRNGFDCHQDCFGGFLDQGLFCRLQEYGRGAGYPWRFSDGFSDGGMWARCQNDYGKGNCEKYLAIVYPKCRAGFRPIECCICRPNSFRCADRGYQAAFQVDLSCAKRIIIGDPKPMTCSSSQHQQAGLCYTPCRTSYTGVGPVCWGQPPNKWVQCGMGAATTSITCASTIFSQVQSAVMLAINIATFGASGEATALAKGAEIGADLASQIKGKFNELKALFNKYEDFRKFLQKAGTAASTAITAKDIINVLQMSNATPADIIRVCAEVASIFDPTGVAGVVAAYSYPLCKDIKPL